MINDAYTNDAPIGERWPPSLSVVWNTRDGIPCVIRPSTEGTCGYAQLPPHVVKEWVPDGSLAAGLRAFLGIDDDGGPDENGWVQAPHDPARDLDELRDATEQLAGRVLQLAQRLEKHQR